MKTKDGVTVDHGDEVFVICPSGRIAKAVVVAGLMIVDSVSDDIPTAKVGDSYSSELAAATNTVPFKTVSGSELVIDYIRNAQKKWDEHFEDDEDGIRLKRGGACYYIHWNRCDTHAKIVSWVMHLSEKDWMDLWQIRAFVGAASHHNNLDCHAPI